MATHDYSIANDTGANVRTDINNVLSAIVSNNSSSSAPSTTYAYQWWADTSSDTLKQRNSSNNGWTSILTLSTGIPAGVGTTANKLVQLNGSAELPAVSGANLTNLPTAGMQAEEDYWSFDMSSATGTTVHSISGSFTPKLAWMTYNPNGSVIGMVTGWMNVSGNTAGSQNNGAGSAGYYSQGNGMFQCACTGGKQQIDMTASASGQYTITNVRDGASTSGTGYFSLILFGN